MKDMPHLVEKCHNVVMSHERRFLRRWFSKIGYHSGSRVTAFSRGEFIAWKEGPDCSMRILGICVKNHALV